MLSKCANPECSEQFRYLHQGKLFHLTPILELQALSEDCCGFLYERFWLCDRCSTKMTIVWDGFQAKLVGLAPDKTPTVSVQEQSIGRSGSEKAAESAGYDDRGIDTA